jgi:DNA invertase Pin-like site-specific DNA recombinase
MHLPTQTPPTRFVCYLRVSTKQQKSSGLGLDGQKRAVGDYIARCGGTCLATFTETESGRRDDRPELRKAIAAATKSKAVILVATLDRLARSVEFVAGLLRAKIDFRAVDFPDANIMMLQILSVFAEYEARMISDRTKAGLESRRRRMLVVDPTFKLGTLKNLQRGNSPAPAINRARARASAQRLRPVIDQLRREGITSAHAMCRALNDRGYVTDRRSQFYPATVLRVLNRLGR